MKIKRSLACLLAVLFLLPLIPVNRAYAEPFWSMDFKAFVLDQEYFQTGLSFNSDAYYQTRFTLYDFERDGEPELLVFNGGPSLAQMTVYVFKHTSQGINHVGNVGFRSCELFYYEDSSLPGVFCTEGNNGNFRTVYYELQNNRIISEDVTDSGITGGPIYLSFYTLDEIRTVGWGEFVLSTCGISGTNVDESVDETQWDESEGETNTNESESTLNPQQQFASNIFLSNFSEQGAFERRDFDLNNPFVDDLVFFAYLYCKINRHEMLGTAQVNDSYYYTLSLADANTVLNRHIALSLSEDEAASFPINTDPSSRYNSFYDAGTFYFPAADGESYNRLTVVENMFLSDDGRYMVYFNIYELDIQEYWRTNGVDSSFYYLSASQAANDPRLTWKKSGVAIVTPYNNNGTDTYQLQYYRVGGKDDPINIKCKRDAQMYECTFSSDLFRKGASIPNNDLAIFSAILSMAVYHDEGTSSLEDIYTQMGINSENYYDNSDERDSPYRFSIAEKQMLIEGETYILLMIVVRGTVTEYERNEDALTRANTDFPTGHKAYDLVNDFRRDVIQQLNLFVMDHPELKMDKVKVLITGHSLGGATANLIGAEINYAIKNNGRWYNIHNIEDVYDYTFGAIDSVKTSSTVSKGYGNIHNIFNFYDSFGPFGWKHFTAAGNSGHGKFGHIDLFTSDIDQGTFGTFYNHLIDTYLNALYQNKVEYDLDNKKKAYAFRCPIDIIVYQGDKVVAQVTDDRVRDDVTRIPTAVVNSEKFFLLSNDNEYRFEIIPTDNGTMQCEIYDASTGSDAKSFTDVKLELGRTLYTEVSSTAPASDTRLYVLDSNRTLVAEVNTDGTETVIQENGAGSVAQENGIGSVVQENRTDTSAKESDALGVSTAIPRWIIIAAAVTLIALLVLVILLITRKEQPVVKKAKKSSSRNSKGSIRLPAFSDTHCCVCGRQLDDQYKVFLRAKDGREARLDRSCFRKINTLQKRNYKDPEDIRNARRYIRSRYGAVDPVVEEQLRIVAEFYDK